jgi:hypothetical protein
MRNFGRRIIQNSECPHGEMIAAYSLVIALVSVVALVVTVLEYQCAGCCKARSPSATDCRISFEVRMLRTDIPASQGQPGVVAVAATVMEY